MKSGFTTGSCAAAATRASLLALISKKTPDGVEIVTPSGAVYKAKADVSLSEDGGFAESYVVKESGDDPDITAGIRIYSRVSFTDDSEIRIVGGKGIGKVTRPGLDQPVGEWAINSTPRKMIRDTVTDVLSAYDIDSGVLVEISAPEGEEIAKKTFNPHMGIEGGISIIGTSGIVKPMSTEALVDTIRLDIRMQYSEGKNICIIVPGNYGVTFLENNYGMSEKDIVLCSNFAGESIRIAKEEGFNKILFCSHIGKMIKVSGGVMNTHSMYGDNRMTFMCDAYREACIMTGRNIDEGIISEILECVSTTAALDILKKIEFVNEVSNVIVGRTKKNLITYAGNDIDIDCILYENKYGELARSY